MKYILKENRLGLPAGSFVYTYTGATYGLDRDDEYYTGVPHVAVTAIEDGSGPFITCPISNLEEISNVH
jgi:hypothetical protein